MQLVIGDRFSSFASAAGALTRSEAVQALFSGEISTSLAIGQGLSDDDQKLVALLSNARSVPIVSLAEGRQRAEQAVTHKHIIANGLISNPVRTAERVLEADLIIDDTNEIMSDHLTGCHIQGMMLIEAIRQMFVAAAQLDDATTALISDVAVVIQKIDISFENFAFPIATTIRHTTLIVDKASKDKIAFKALVEVEQNGTRCAVAHVDYLAIEAAVLGPKEALKAKRCAQTYLRAMTDNINVAAANAA